MQEHERFEELCALLPIGQLTAAEYQELVEHLKVCANCRHATEDFALVLDQLPVTETSIDERALLSLQRDSYRERFLRRASTEGIPFSEEILQPQNRVRFWRWPRRQASYSLAFASTVAVILVVFAFRTWRQVPPPQRAVIAQTNQRVPAQVENDNATLIAQLQTNIVALQRQSEEQEQIIRRLQARVRNSDIVSAEAKVQLAEANDHLLRLKTQLADANKTLNTAEIELASVKSAKDEAEVAMVEQRFKLTEVSDQLKNERAAAERDRQLSQAVSDVRDLMGARNLHIIDVSDVDGNGKAKKAFGRVYLTEGKSLIFYAFDLGHKGNASKVSFQAWGQWDGQSKIAKNLGVFRIDDDAQRRWVLKVDDPEKLKNINTLFVTVEPLGGGIRPTGKKLLYAYFGLQPNHP